MDPIPRGPGKRFKVLVLRKARELLAWLKVVVAILEPQKFNPIRQSVSFNLRAGAELIAGALAEQRRCLERLQMHCTQLLRFSRWMKGITNA